MNRSPIKNREGSPLSPGEDPFATVEATSDGETTSEGTRQNARDGWRQHGGTVFLQRMERAIELREPEQLRRRVKAEESTRDKKDEARDSHFREVAERCRNNRLEATRATQNRAKQDRENAAQRERALNDESVDQVQNIIQSLLSSRRERRDSAAGKEERRRRVETETEGDGKEGAPTASLICSRFPRQTAGRSSPWTSMGNSSTQAAKQKPQLQTCC